MSFDTGQVEELTIDGYRLVPTCRACPEQYDVLCDQKAIGSGRRRPSALLRLSGAHPMCRPGIPMSTLGTPRRPHLCHTGTFQASSEKPAKFQYSHRQQGVHRARNGIYSTFPYSLWIAARISGASSPRNPRLLSELIISSVVKSSEISSVCSRAKS